MSGIVWEDPPASGRGRGVAWADLLAPLREHPGRWANLGDRHASSVTQINAGRVAGITRGEFEAKGRNVKDNRITLYVRYVGDQS